MAHALLAVPETHKPAAREGRRPDQLAATTHVAGSLGVDLGGFVRRLAERIADAADADQWAIAAVGVAGTGRPDFQELVPRRWLETLNLGQPARYRLTLVLRGGQQDLGIVRLGTLRPSGFSERNVASARVAAALAGTDLALALDPTREASGPATRAAPHLQGLVVIDAQHHVRLVSPGTQCLLGWRDDNLAGRPCAPALACHDREGHLLCGHCGVDAALERRGHVPARMISIASASGGRREVLASYWYVPAQAEGEATVITLLRDAGLAGPSEARDQGGEP
jgi:hypothetical protein